MKKLVQLKNKENENLDPININYETRLQNLESTKKITQIIENEFSSSWYQASINSNSKNIIINISQSDTNITVFLTVNFLRLYSTSNPYFIKDNNNNLCYQCCVIENTFCGLNRAEAGTDFVANVYVE